jgi:hypothetical protein
MVPQVYDGEKSLARIDPKPFYNPVMPVTSALPNKRFSNTSRVPEWEAQ